MSILIDCDLSSKTVCAMTMALEKLEACHVDESEAYEYLKEVLKEWEDL